MTCDSKKHNCRGIRLKGRDYSQAEPIHPYCAQGRKVLSAFAMPLWRPFRQPRTAHDGSLAGTPERLEVALKRPYRQHHVRNGKQVVASASR